MFTGLIQRVGRLADRQVRGTGARLTIEHAPWETMLVLGESVAVMGACLTVTAREPGWFSCDALAETLDRTTLGRLAVGRAVNLERALRVGDRLGGHFVSGHVDGLGTVEELRPAGADRILRIACDPDLARGMVWKGSIAIDGVSLTLTAAEAAGLEVNLIPLTWEETTLGTLTPGTRVNLETDMIGKYVQRYLGGHGDGGGLTVEKLMRAGFAR